MLHAGLDLSRRKVDVCLAVGAGARRLPRRLQLRPRPHRAPHPRTRARRHRLRRTQNQPRTMSTCRNNPGLGRPKWLVWERTPSRRVASRWYVVGVSRAICPLPSSACQRTVVKAAGSPSWKRDQRERDCCFHGFRSAVRGRDSAPPDAFVLFGRAGLDERHARSPGSGGSAALCVVVRRPQPHATAPPTSRRGGRVELLPGVVSAAPGGPRSARQSPPGPGEESAGRRWPRTRSGTYGQCARRSGRRRQSW